MSQHFQNASFLEKETLLGKKECKIHVKHISLGKYLIQIVRRQNPIKASLIPSFLIFSQRFRTINWHPRKLHLRNEKNIWPLMEQIFTLKRGRGSEHFYALQPFSIKLLSYYS